MFSSGPNYTKLKTNLRLAINRLKLLEKKKTEIALKSRKEIADYISAGKTERAKIRVEHIIREDYLVEAMEVTEMYCDLILARFGLINQMKDLDEGLAEAISSLIWVAPRLQADVGELKVISDQLCLKYGKPYGQACKEQQVATISEKLIHKLSVQAPPKLMVEKYLIEIAKNYNVEYEPDPQVMREGDWSQNTLISLDDPNNLGGDEGGASGGGGGGGAMNIPNAPTGFVGYPSQPMPQQPFSYPQVNIGFQPGISGNNGFVPSSKMEEEETVDRNHTITSGSHIELPTILVTNPQSLSNSFEEFKNLISDQKPHVITVSETWFSPNRPACNFHLDGYSMFNNDREERRGGGVALYVSNDFEPIEPQIKVPPELECIWAVTKNNLYLCGLYHPPRAATGSLLMDHIVNATVDIRKRDPQAHFIIMGDFNELPRDRLNSCMKLKNIVDEPTHGNSTIDLVLTDIPHMFGGPLLLPPLGNSHHNCVLIKPK